MLRLRVIFSIFPLDRSYKFNLILTVKKKNRVSLR